MYRKTLYILIIFLLAFSSFAIAQTDQDPEAERAKREAQREAQREARQAAREAQQKEKEKIKEKHKDRIDNPEPGELVQEVKVKIASGARVNVNNFLGDVTVTGTDSDTLEAVANDGGDRIPLEYREAGSNYYISHSPAHKLHRGGEANIEVKLPRSASLNLSIVTGDAKVIDVGGDVKANIVTGDLRIECAKGRVDARSVSGSVEIIGASGDVDGESVSGDLVFRGRLRANGNYRLKSMSGEVEMYVQDNAPGFTATLKTFSGELETDFPLKVESTKGYGSNQLLIGRYGDGQTKVSIDSFSGAARIKKGNTGKSCR